MNNIIEYKLLLNELTEIEKPNPKRQKIINMLVSWQMNEAVIIHQNKQIERVGKYYEY